jgi:hypothetical protein
MINNELLVDFNAIGDVIPDEEDKTVKKIAYAIKIRSYSIDQIPMFLRGFIKGLSREYSGNSEWKEARVWYLKNVERALKGVPIDPVYNSIHGIIEGIMEKYKFMLDNIVTIYNLCIDYQARWSNTKKISSILVDVLLFDYFLKEWTDSDFHLSDLLLEQIENDSDEEPYIKSDPWDIRGNNYLI